MPATFIYKPNTYKGPVILVPAEGPQTPPVFTLPDGSTVQGQYLNTNEGRHQFVLPDQLIGMSGITVSYNGQTGTIANGAMSYEGSSMGGWEERLKGSMSDPTAGMGSGGMGGFGGLPNPFMMMFNPINYQPIDYKPIDYTPMETAPYKFTDPIEAAGRYNKFNLQQEENAFRTGIKRGTELTDLDTEQTIRFANRMSGLSQDLVAAENTFNQAQKLKGIDFAMPDLRTTLDQKRQRAGTYAQGRLLSSAEDRAYEIAARSASADGSLVRGFGDDSVFGKRTSDILSAEQRLGIAQMGESMLNDWISQGSSLLIDTPLKSAISQRLPSTPQILPSQQAAAQQSNLTNLTTVPLQFGITSEINQNQFSTNLEQGTRQFNASNTFSKDQFNAGNTLQKDSFNASNTLAKDQFNSSGQFAATQAQFSGLQGNYDRVTAASNRADDIHRQELHDQAASAAADQNIDAQQDAGNAGVAGQIVGAVVGAVTGMLSGSAAGVPAAPPGVPQIVSATTKGQTVRPTGTQSLEAITGSFAPAAAQVVQGAPASIEGGGGVQGAPGGPVSVSGGGVGISPSGGRITSSGVPTTYNGVAIPVQSGAYDAGASIQSVSQGLRDIGGLVQNVGRAGPSTPQVSSLGTSLSTGANAAEIITTSFPQVSTPEGQMAMADHLKNAALANANTPEQEATVNSIFSQVKEHLDTGVDIKGQAAGIAGYIKNYNEYNDAERVRGATNITFAGQDLENEYGIKDLSSDSLASIPIAGTNNKMTLQDAISLQNTGYNVSGLVKNWDEIEEVHKATGGKGSILNIASTGRDLNLIGTDTPEKVQARQMALREAGASPAGAWGAGAVSVPAINKKTVEKQGFVAIGNTKDGQVIAVPRSTAASSALSDGIVGSGMDEKGLNQMGSKTLEISQSTANVYNNWSTDYIPRSSQSMGDRASVASGLYKLGQDDPYKLGNILFSNLKNKTQIEGDIKVDPSKDLEAVSHLAGNALATLVYGSPDDPVTHKTGHEVTKKATEKYDGRLTMENFDNVQANLRQAFKDNGIETKEDAYALSNQLKIEGRISDIDLVSTQQGINFAFDKKGFQAANQLLEGVRLSSKGESA